MGCINSKEIIKLKLWQCIIIAFPLTLISDNFVILFTSIIVFIIGEIFSLIADTASALHAHLVVDKDFNEFNFKFIVFLSCSNVNWISIETPDLNIDHDSTQFVWHTDFTLDLKALHASFPIWISFT